MKITEKQKQQLIDLNDSRVNEILDLGLKVGEWYFNGNGKTLFCYNGTNNKRYGFNSSGIWSIGIGCAYDSTLKKATKQEVEQALTDEAKRRGFKEGVKVSRSWVALDDSQIFHNGEWAEIIDGN